MSLPELHRRRIHLSDHSSYHLCCWGMGLFFVIWMVCCCCCCSNLLARASALTHVVSISHRTHSSVRSALHCTTADDICSTDNIESNSQPIPFSIERVSNRRRALDVLVDRSWSVSASEYRQTCLDDGNDVTEQEAVDFLTTEFDENGRSTTIFGEPLVQFAAICSKEEFARTGGVVGTVDAQVKIEDDNAHVYLKNLCVNERLRRQGIASALVNAVKAYASPTYAVVLHVDRQNLGAIHLYQKEGFEFAEQREGDGRMIAFMSERCRIGFSRSETFTNSK